MTTQKLLCPISHRLCKECILYRGRHYCLPLCRLYGSQAGDSKVQLLSDSTNAENFKALSKFLEPWHSVKPREGAEAEVKLKVIDMENGGS